MARTTSPVLKSISTTAAAELLDLTPDQFRRLVKAKKIEPVGYYANPHYRTGPDCPLWSERRIKRLAGTKAIAELLARSEKRAEAIAAAPARRDAALAKRYPDPAIALPVAAEAMFSLNRYAKHRSCKAAHRAEIYSLKNDFVRLLYVRGLATEVREHTVERDGQRCNRCNGSGDDPCEVGSGEYDLDGYETDPASCNRCGGSGYWREPRKDVFIAFRFAVGEKTYSWHQPQEYVTYPYTVTAPAEAWKSMPEEKPVALPARKFAEAKALIRFVIAKGKEVAA